MKLRQPIETLLGTPEAHLLRQRERKVARRPMQEVIAAVKARCEARGETQGDEPLFLLSAGWRSGSTLVQRLINSKATYFLWGEPYARADLVPRLADSIRPITDVWPQEADVLCEDIALEDRWTANLHPPPETLLESHRALFRTLLAPPDGTAGELGWGLKEVRLSAQHALYLRLLFPRAKFVFLVRDPVDAYASYKSWRSWYVRWPEDQVRTAWAYGGFWSELAGSFLAEVDTVGGIVIRYEDVIPGGAAIVALEELLGLEVDGSVLANRISGREGGPNRLSGLERRIVQRRTAPVARRLGYTH